MTVAGEITQTVEIGNAPNVTTQTLHSEPNAIDAVSQKEAVAKEETIEGDAMATDVAEMTAEVEMTVAEMTDVDAEMIIAALTPIMTGIVVNVTIPTSHLEPNVIVVAPLKEEVAHHLNNGKVMTVELAKEGMPLNLELVIGIAHNCGKSNFAKRNDCFGCGRSKRVGGPRSKGHHRKLKDPPPLHSAKYGREQRRNNE